MREGAMSEIKDGGPAFPVLRDDVAQNDAWGGMTLRDYFAAKALTGLLSYPGDAQRGSYHNNSSPEYVALDAYEYADAMLRARGAA
jgi:hypothetical protein